MAHRSHVSLAIAMPTVIQEFEATKALLATSSGSPSFGRLCISQHVKLLNVVSTSAMSTEHVMQLWPLVDRLGFSAPQAGELHDAISTRNTEYTANPRGAKTRAVLQDFGAISGYFTSGFWTSWQSDMELDPLAAICDLGITLGGRNLTESTFQLWTALLLLLQNKGDAGKCSVLTPTQKNEVCKHVKRVWRRRVKGAGPRLIEHLPLSPSDLLSDHPALYAAVYGSETVMPLQCPFKTALQSISATVKMRNCGGSRSTAVSTVSPMLVNPPPDMARLFMQLLSQQGVDMFRQQGNRAIQDGGTALHFGASPAGGIQVISPPRNDGERLHDPVADAMKRPAEGNDSKKRTVESAAVAVRAVMGRVQVDLEEDGDDEDDEAKDKARPAKTKAKGKAKSKAKAKPVAKATPKTKAGKKEIVAKGVGLKTKFQISAEESIMRVRVRFDDGTSFSKKYDTGMKDKTIAMIKTAATKMLNKAK